jgi:phenylpropionate dioxygenase-like ring-hydroxylating dioxygenase large terminal subunit
MFLKNCWYAAGWSKDLDRSLVPRRILNEPVVMFRGTNGALSAIEDRCCHRAAPLSRGTLTGDAIECAYHGLKFDGSGACVEIPAQTHVPNDMRVRSYPVVERWNVAWIWMGDPAAADPSKIPDLAWLDDPAWRITPGYLHLKANYQLLTDNLLDLTHVSYLHKRTLAGDPREATTPQETELLPNGVRAGRWMLGFKPPPLFAIAGNFSEDVDRWQFSTWHPPSIVYLDIGCAKAGTGAPEGDRSQGISMWSNHLLTPETELTTHYFFSFARNFRIDDDELSKLLYEGSRETFLEDSELLEAQQRNLDGGSIAGLRNIRADAAQLQARRMLEALIAAEQPRGSLK